MLETTATLVALSFILFAAPESAQAQNYVWGGTGSTTTTSNYNLGTNWANPPAGAPPVAAGQSATFGNTGRATVTVTAGPITPDSWTFRSTAQSYTFTGAAVNFGLAGATGGLINHANSGQTISIANNIGESVAGVQVQQLGNSTLILKGANTYSGGTLISNGGTVRVTNSTPGVSSSVGTGTITLNDGQFQAGGANLSFSNNFAINNTPFGSAIDTNGRRLTISGNITDGNGPGALTVRDSTLSGSVLVLTGANTYTGGTTICDCATLQLGTVA